MIRRVLFYSDLVGFGGHEVLTIDAVRFMSEQPDLDVHFAYCEANARLHEALYEIEQRHRLTLHPLPVKPGGLPGVRTFLWLLRLPPVRSLIECIAPDVVVVSQGNIELSALGLLATRWARVRTISYIPMAHRIALPRKWSSRIRDVVDGWLYRLPEKFITSNGSAKQMLRKQGVKSQISIVRNGIELAATPLQHRLENRARHGFSPHDYVIAIIGRILFRQKAQDLVVNAVASYRSEMTDVRFCIVGEGTDEQRLRRMINKASLEDRISMLPWSNDLSPIYSATDMLLIPSHFEGMPVVMHEAMWHGLPIVASAVDGMKEVLPAEWLFRCGDARSLVDAISRVRSTDNSKVLLANKRRVREEFSLSQFQQSFCREVVGSGCTFEAETVAQLESDAI